LFINITHDYSLLCHCQKGLLPLIQKQGDHLPQEAPQVAQHQAQLQVLHQVLHQAHPLVHHQVLQSQLRRVRVETSKITLVRASPT
jgi:hypothetical protein